ncbi:MAG TPA: CCA tRNA nucleotidyltransferase [Phycisphaerae bacterium]|nr:CCA tRNA nucleotidyltransferase [Phycisphaerae bacterium]
MGERGTGRIGAQLRAFAGAKWPDYNPMMRTNSQENFAFQIVQRLQQAGHVAYWAGGCVRDRLMGGTPKDFDVATSARPEEVLTLFPRGQKVGVAFGVILVREKKLQVEIATFRADGDYSDGRHPDSVRFTNAEEDAKRRDFTCNALFLDPTTSQLHDFVGGQRDIEAKILRAVGNPHARFAEDHLRMLRAVRFAARLSFTIDADTRLAIEELQKKIEGISRERIGEELRMMLEHPTRVAALDLLASFPGMFSAALGITANPLAAERDWPVVSGLPAEASRALVLIAMLLDMEVAEFAETIATLRSRLMLSNDETDVMTWLSGKLPALEDWEDLSKATMKRMMADRWWRDLDALYRADPANADVLLAFGERVAMLQDEGVSPPPFVTGDVLIKLGVAPGPAFKGWLDALYDRQLNGEFSRKEDAVEAARKLLQGN